MTLKNKPIHLRNAFHLAMLSIAGALISMASAHANQASLTASMTASPSPYNVNSESDVDTPSNNGWVHDRFVISRDRQLVLFQSVYGQPERMYPISQPLGERGTLHEVHAFYDPNSGDVNAFVLNLYGQVELYQWSLTTNWQRHLISQPLMVPPVAHIEYADMSGGLVYVQGRMRNGQGVLMSWSGPQIGWSWRYN